MIITYTILQSQTLLNGIQSNGTPLNVKIHERTFGPFSITFRDYLRECDPSILARTAYNQCLGEIFGAPIFKDNTIPFNTISIEWP